MSDFAKTRGRVSLTLAAALFAFARFSSADVTPTSTAQPLDNDPDYFSKHAVLNYWGYWTGGALTSDFMNEATPGDQTGVLDPTDPQHLENLITVGWKPNPDTTVGAIAHFMVYPVGETAGQNLGFQAQMRDPGLVLSQAKLINSDGVTLTGKVFSYLGVFSPGYHDLQAIGDMVSIVPTAVLSWDIPKTRFNVGVYGQIAGYIPRPNSVDPRRYKIYIAPNGSYQITKSVQATMWVDLIQATHKDSQGAFTGMSEPDMDVEPGIGWDLNSHITLNPCINIYPGHMTMASTSFQMVIIGKTF